jgi:hypothetical protein
VANLSETCDPDNAVQLITKVQVAPNNTNDNTLLLEALPDLKERSGLETLYTDGPYAGPEVDEALQHHQVEQIQTGINGRPLDPGKLYLVDFEIEQNESGVPTHITCPQGQSVPVRLSRRTSTRPSARAVRLGHKNAVRLGPGKDAPPFVSPFLLRRSRWPNGAARCGRANKRARTTGRPSKAQSEK